jgi:signal peptidase II
MREQWIVVSAIVVGFDQLTKYLSTQHLTLVNSIKVLPGFDLALSHNTGAAFNFLANAGGWQRWFFIGLALLMSIIIYVWLGRLSTKDKQEAFALSLILGGAIGNVIDRITQGYVTDFILLYYKQWQWPTFNLADSAICLGVVLLMPILFKKNVHSNAL